MTLQSVYRLQACRSAVLPVGSQVRDIGLST